ncbi:MAG TPA: apolipoprotein N-acyltransferase [Candidatus Acidoferrum sp.]|nr:apolipoprotein N-acyltransferase [Candidatus Acidoferrum sp.]
MTTGPLREVAVHGLAVVAGAVALALAFPGTDWSGAAWVALAPVVVLALLRPPRAAFGLGWLGGFVFFLLLLRWLNFTFRVYSAIPWPLVWLPTALLAAYCGLYTGLFAGALSWIGARRSSLAAVAAAPFLWVVLEWTRGWLMGGFPWGHLGYSQYRHLAVIQIAELGGVYAVSFLVIAVNAALAAVVVSGPRRAAAPLGIAALLVVATLTFGHARLGEVAPAETASIAALQPSIAQPLKWDPNFAMSTLANYFDLTRRAGQARPDLIVWPETSTPTVLRQDPALLAALRRLSGEVGAPLLVGSVDIDQASAPKYRNSAFLLDERGVVNRYDKIQLVPFGEYVPLSGVIGFVRGWAEFIADLEPGSRSVVFSGPPAPFGIVICYEGIFPALVRRFVKDGARFMVNMTNDGWFGETAGPLQHLAMYPFRAVEHRVSVVRAANTGVSAMIAPSGEITRTLPPFTRGVLADRVPLRTRQTLYTRLGDWLAYLSLAVSAVGLGAAAWRRA